MIWPIMTLDYNMRDHLIMVKYKKKQEVVDCLAMLYYEKCYVNGGFRGYSRHIRYNYY